MKSSRGSCAEERAEDLVDAARRPGSALITYSSRSLRDFRAFHLADQLRVGQRIEVREGLEVDAVGLPVEEQRVGLDRVEHRRRGALGDVDVDRAQVLGEDRARSTRSRRGCP